MQKMYVMTTILGPVCWDLLKPVDGYGNEKDAPKGKGEDENSNRCYSTPECFTVGCGRHLEPVLNSNCFIGS